MRYLFAAFFLASCTALTPSPTDNASTIEPRLPAVTPSASESEQEIRKPKPKASPPPAPEISSCANLKMGDLKETIRAKLDCISENAK
jgi:hypothetical protein